MSKRQRRRRKPPREQTVLVVRNADVALLFVAVQHVLREGDPACSIEGIGHYLVCDQAYTRGEHETACSMMHGKYGISDIHRPTDAEIEHDANAAAVEPVPLDGHPGISTSFFDGIHTTCFQRDGNWWVCTGGDTLADALDELYAQPGAPKRPRAEMGEESHDRR